MRKPTAANRPKYKVGDFVEVIHYTPVRHPAGWVDEIGTEALFRRIVGKRFRILGFDKYGHIELRPTRHDHIWIGAEDIKLVLRKRKKTG